MDFLDEDLPKAEKESKDFSNSMFMATYHGYQKDYYQIANYLESAAKSARRLAEMQKQKKLYDQARNLLYLIEQEEIRRFYP
ncbi:hypothetical protein [Oceanobacillus profundus]|uniref:Uncharacterized protein n=1 Tax=Oceanobacillus profundus TaxID=372463 RepID=A0A417YK11_9BACI|nr:hypothetical protein [Oceanobacillus profundus]RHW33549.1 hypothetical protein D1B32_05775 [Oceanobacillus profundus]